MLYHQGFFRWVYRFTAVLMGVALLSLAADWLEDTLSDDAAPQPLSQGSTATEDAAYAVHWPRR